MWRFILRISLVIGILLIFTVVILIRNTDQQTQIFIVPEIVYEVEYLKNEQNDAEMSQMISKPLIRTAKVSNISCIPHISGYSVELDYEIFGYKSSAKSCDIGRKDKISIKNRGIFVDCEYNNVDEFIPGYDKSYELFGKHKLNYTKEKYYPGFPATSEYYYAKCKGSPPMSVLFNIYNNTAKEEAKKIAEGKKKPIKKPLSVIIIIIDSVSRQSLFRNLPQTVNFLNTYMSNSAYGKDFTMFDFLNNNAIKPKTIYNMVPIYTGQSYSSLYSKVANKTWENESDQLLFKENEKKSIWHEFKNQGFLTMFSFETVEDYLSEIIGKKIIADHVVCNFWNMANKYFGFSDFSERKQVCIGGLPSYKHSFNYLLDYLVNYPGMNKFAYIHLSIAHEKSGNRLYNADSDFLVLLNEIINLHKSRQENLALFFMSDHGRGKSSPLSFESLAEQVQPFTILISSKEIIKDMKGYYNLQNNTNRLTSRYDIYKTIRLLAHYPYMDYHELIKENKKISTEYPSKNLFLEQIPTTRTCEESGIYMNYCFCRPLKKADIGSWKTNRALNYFIEASIRNINTINSKKIDNKGCDYVELDQILSIEYFEYEQGVEYGPVLYVIQYNTTKSANIQVKGSSASPEKFEKLSMEPLASHTLERFMDSNNNDINIIHKIWSVIRLDNYTNTPVTDSICEDYMKNRLPDEFITGKSANCKSLCNEKNMTCIQPEFNEKNLEKLKEYGNILEAGLGKTIIIMGNLVIISMGDHCMTPHSESLYACYCRYS
ncbi:hypothetical protein SteCoe_4482 [Stentor coeruleus]|uniref:Uncharacterized protein n=1 Tax=Stentor coeruleus TaxID=5963 RepID=A0A1R2CUS4_9CILI|nr:hypothetical protein SteCoe_4482 [Stentor coeruleus]